MIYKLLCMPFALFAFIAGMSVAVIASYLKPRAHGAYDEPMWGGWPLMSLALNLATFAVVVYFVREDKDFRVQNLSKVTFLSIIIISYGLGIAAAVYFVPSFL
ncbi:MAG TPA: hypothetical protein VIM11_09945 [Tepidisphaeraceae bacterium]|jgi:hypothetical protein